MSKLPLISGKNLCKILKNLGFEMIHGKGSHMRFKHLDGRRTVVPVHANEDLGRGLIREILKQIKVSREEYEKLRD
jgi:predicted RNA binding protein YcfA (HicA-like mRNA interferase family)